MNSPSWVVTRLTLTKYKMEDGGHIECRKMLITLQHADTRMSRVE